MGKQLRNLGGLLDLQSANILLRAPAGRAADSRGWGWVCGPGESGLEPLSSGLKRSRALPAPPPHLAFLSLIPSLNLRNHF